MNHNSREEALSNDEVTDDATERVGIPLAASTKSAVQFIVRLQPKEA